MLNVQIQIVNSNILQSDCWTCNKLAGAKDKIEEEWEEAHPIHRCKGVGEEVIPRIINRMIPIIFNSNQILPQARWINKRYASLVKGAIDLIVNLVIQIDKIQIPILPRTSSPKSTRKDQPHNQKFASLEQGAINLTARFSTLNVKTRSHTLEVDK